MYHEDIGDVWDLPSSLEELLKVVVLERKKKRVHKMLITETLETGNAKLQLFQGAKTFTVFTGRLPQSYHQSVIPMMTMYNTHFKL